MALSELAALEVAYQTLRPLDPAARRRALQWLTDALADEPPLTPVPADDDRDAPEATDQSAAAAPAEPRSRRARSRAAAVATDTGSAKRGRTTRIGRTGKTTANKRATTTTSQPGARPYRRMPPAEDVMAAYRQVGSVSGLAEHFGVPRHTVQGWARQLRGHGYSIGQTR
jgi:hypothetical protein